MTTLSKEAIDLAAEKFDYSDFSGEFRTSSDWLHAFADHIATLARADLVAENERLKSIPMKYRRMAFNAELQDEADKLRTALAAAEARETKLLRLIEKLPCESESLLWEVINEKRDALVQPRDDSALREMIAGVYDECAKACEDDAKGWTDYSCEMAARDCADAIRALAEKAKGK